jgi:hypothetical protein
MNIEEYTYENILKAIQEFKRKSCFGVLLGYMGIYEGASHRLQKMMENPNDYVEEIKEDKKFLANLYQQIQDEFKELQEKNIELDELYYAVEEKRNGIYGEKLAEPVCFEPPSIDEVEQRCIDSYRSAGEALEDDEIDVHRYSDEEILGMNPPTELDYELYIDELDNCHFYYSRRMEMLKYYEENDLITIDLLSLKLSLYDTPIKYYVFMNDKQKLKEIDKERENTRKQISKIKEDLKHVRSQIGHEGKAIKKALMDRKDYYVSKKETIKKSQDHGKNR